MELLHKVQILWVGQKNLKKSPNLFWNYILGNVKTKWEIFSIFCDLLKTSELNHQLRFRSSFSVLNFWSCLIEHVTYLKSKKNNVVTSLEMLKKTSTYLDFSHADLAHAHFSQSKKTHEPRTCCILLKMVEVVILSVAKLVTTVIFFSACVKLDNSRNWTQKMKTLE